MHALEPLAVAIADGYQRIGPEIPAMGEHWIHVGLLFEEGIDPSRPEILSYIRGGEGRTLVGVAYAVPLLVGEAPPSVTGLIADWHDHSGGVEEELLRIKPDDLGEDMTQPRVAVVHAWIWAQNPAGLFAADNWTLPFLRQGWDAPAEATVEASKALSLVTGGEAFYIRRLETIGWRDDGSFREVVGRGREAVKDWLAVRSPEAEFTPEDMVTLGAIWDRIWDQLDAVASPDEVKRLRAIRAR